MTAYQLFMQLMAANAAAAEDGFDEPDVQILLDVGWGNDIQFANGDVQSVTYHEGVITIAGTSKGVSE